MAAQPPSAAGSPPPYQFGPRRCGVYIPVAIRKRVHERKIVVPAMWNALSLQNILGGEMLEMSIQLNVTASLAVCVNANSYRNDHMPVNPRASFLCNSTIHGDVFILVKQVDATGIVNILDFTLNDLLVLMRWVYQMRRYVPGLAGPPMANMAELQLEEEGEDGDEGFFQNEINMLRSLPFQVIPEEFPDTPMPYDTPMPVQLMSRTISPLSTMSILESGGGSLPPPSPHSTSGTISPSNLLASQPSQLSTASTTTTTTNTNTSGTVSASGAFASSTAVNAPPSTVAGEIQSSNVSGAEVVGGDGGGGSGGGGGESDGSDPVRSPSMSIFLQSSFLGSMFFSNCASTVTSSSSSSPPSATASNASLLYSSTGAVGTSQAPIIDAAVSSSSSSTSMPALIASHLPQPQLSHGHLPPDPTQQFFSIDRNMSGSMAVDSSAAAGASTSLSSGGGGGGGGGGALLIRPTGALLSVRSPPTAPPTTASDLMEF